MTIDPCHDHALRDRIVEMVDKVQRMVDARPPGRLSYEIRIADPLALLKLLRDCQDYVETEGERMRDA